MRRFAVLTITFALLLGAAGKAWGAAFLFEDLVWGTPKSELEKLPEASPGEGSFAGDLLLPEAMYASMPWSVQLEFEDERLARVTLTERYSRERMDAVTAQLRADKYEMLSMLIDNTYLDLVKTLQTAGPDGAREAMMRFIQDNTPEQRMVYAWFDGAGMNEDLRRMAGNLQRLMMSVPVETRQAEVILLRDPETSAPGVILVSFSFPLLKLLETL